MLSSSGSRRRESRLTADRTLALPGARQRERCAQRRFRRRKPAARARPANGRRPSAGRRRRLYPAPQEVRRRRRQSRRTRRSGSSSVEMTSRCARAGQRGRPTRSASVRIEQPVIDQSPNRLTECAAHRRWVEPLAVQDQLEDLEGRDRVRQTVRLVPYRRTPGPHTAHRGALHFSTSGQPLRGVSHPRVSSRASRRRADACNGRCPVAPAPAAVCSASVESRTAPTPTAGRSSSSVAGT